MSGFVRVNKKIIKSGTTTPSTTTPTTSTQTPSQQSHSSLGTGGSLTQPIQPSQETKQQQRLLSKVAAVSQVKIPNGCKPWVSNQYLTSIGIKDLDAILGGGLPLHTVSSIISDVRTNHSEVFSKVHLWEGYLRKQRCIHVSSRSPREAVYFAQSLLKPALTNQNEKLPQTNPRNPAQPSELIGPTPPSDSSKQSRKNGMLGIDDEDDVPMKKPSRQHNPEPLQTDQKAPPKRITQGSVANALNNDETDKKLTIAWQYDKYSNKTMDDSNLSGVNDETFMDDNKDENGSDNEEVAHFHQTLTPSAPTPTSTSHILQSPYDTSNRNINEWKDLFDFHIVSSHTRLSTPPAPQTSSEPPPQQLLSSPISRTEDISPFSPIPQHLLRFHLLSQLSQTIDLPIAKCHIKPPTTQNDESNEQSDEKSNPIVPSRIIFELSPEILLDSLPASHTTPSEYQHYRPLTLSQFFYAIKSLIATTNSLLTFLIPPQCANNPLVYRQITSSSTFISSIASFSSQTSLSHNNISQSQLGSASALFGDKHDGLYTIYQFPRQNTPSFSYKLPDSTLFLYRVKKQLTATITSTATSTIQTLGISKLVLPPEVSRSGDAHHGKGASFGKDLFDEAVDEITKRALAAPNQSTEPSKTKNEPTKETCPTCGNTDINRTTGISNRGSQSLNAKFNMNNTAKQQQQQHIQQKQNNMAILEEEEEEDE